MLLSWLCNILSQSVEIYVSKNFSFDGDSKLMVEMDDNPVKLNFRMNITGYNKYLSKKTVELIFPGQVDLQSVGGKSYYQVIDNRIKIDLDRVVSGQTKHLDGYALDFSVLLIKNDTSFQNDLMIEKHSGFLSQSLKTKVRMASK